MKICTTATGCVVTLLAGRRRQIAAIASVPWLAFGSFLASTFGDGCFQCQIFFSKEDFNCVAIDKALDDLVSDVFLGAFVQTNWHVLASSRRAMRKSSKVSPGCCVRHRKFLHSTDSFIWPSTYCCMTSTMCVASPRCSAVRPRLSTTVSVSQEKQSVRVCTCLAASWSFKPETLLYVSHRAFQALKSTPQLTWRSSFGRSPVRKTFAQTLLSFFYPSQRHVGTTSNSYVQHHPYITWHQLYYTCVTIMT